MGKDAIPALEQLPGLIERASSGKLAVRLSRSQEARLVEAQHRSSDRMVRGLLGMALFVPGTLGGMTAGWSLPAIVLSASGLLLMLRQAYFVGRGEMRGHRGHPPMLRHGGP